MDLEALDNIIVYINCRTYRRLCPSIWNSSP